MELIIIIIIFHCLTFNTDPTGPYRLLCYRGKNLQFTGRKTLQLGEEKPYEPPQQDKKPQFVIFICSSGPTGLYTMSCLLKYFSYFGNHCFLLQLIKAGVYYVPAILYQLLAIFCYYYFCFLYLDYPLYTMPPPP